MAFEAVVHNVLVLRKLAAPNKLVLIPWFKRP
jgi:hypothetical protein